MYKINPPHNVIINNIDKENIITSQMEQWSILSNEGNCMYNLIGTLKHFFMI